MLSAKQLIDGVRVAWNPLWHVYTALAPTAREVYLTVDLLTVGGGPHTSLASFRSINIASAVA